MKEYRFLRVAGIIFKVLSFAVGAIYEILGIVIIVTRGAAMPAVAEGAANPPPIAFGIGFMLGGLVAFFMLFTISEIIGLLLEIKDSSSKT